MGIQAQDYRLLCVILIFRVCGGCWNPEGYIVNLRPAELQSKPLSRTKGEEKRAKKAGERRGERGREKKRERKDTVGEGKKNHKVN